MKEEIEALIAEYERHFSRRFDIERTRTDARSAIEAHLKCPELAPLLRILEDARQNGIALSRVLLPESPRGVAMVTEWTHEDPTGIKRPAFAPVNRQMFQIAHMLRQRQCATNLFIEGPSYDFAYDQSTEVLIPGSDLPVYSEAGQELLLHEPQLLELLIAQQNKSFINCLWHQQFKDMHGIESAESHQKSMQEMPQLSGLTALSENDLLLMNGMLQRQTGFTRTTPIVCVFGQYSIRLSTLIQRCEQYCAAIELFTKMKERRNGEIAARIGETIQTGIPKIFCGRFHSVDMRKHCGEQNIGLIIVTPMSSPPPTDTYFTTQADERNGNYQIIKAVIPQLRAIHKSSIRGIEPGTN